MGNLVILGDLVIFAESGDFVKTGDSVESCDSGISGNSSESGYFDESCDTNESGDICKSGDLGQSGYYGKPGEFCDSGVSNAILMHSFLHFYSNSSSYFFQVHLYSEKANIFNPEPGHQINVIDVISFAHSHFHSNCINIVHIHVKSKTIFTLHPEI